MQPPLPAGPTVFPVSLTWPDGLRHGLRGPELINRGRAAPPRAWKPPASPSPGFREGPNSARGRGSRPRPAPAEHAGTGVAVATAAAGPDPALARPRGAAGLTSPDLSVWTRRLGRRGQDGGRRRGAGRKRGRLSSSRPRARSGRGEEMAPEAIIERAARESGLRTPARAFPGALPAPREWGTGSLASPARWPRPRSASLRPKRLPPPGLGAPQAPFPGNPKNATLAHTPVSFPRVLPASSGPGCARPAGPAASCLGATVPRLRGKQAQTCQEK